MTAGWRGDTVCVEMKLEGLRRTRRVWVFAKSIRAAVHLASGLDTGSRVSVVFPMDETKFFGSRTLPSEKDGRDAPSTRMTV